MTALPLPARRLLATAIIGAALTLVVAAAAASAASIRISGNHFVGVRGKLVRLIGVNRSGTEYACSGPLAGGGFGYGIFEGPTDDRSIKALLTWDVNAVALPLNEACWLGGYAHLNRKFTGLAYRSAIVKYVERLNHFGIYVVIRLAGAAPGDQAYGSDTSTTDNEIPMADADHSLSFWKSAAATFKRHPMVIFHGFDEPHDISWQCLRDGCTAQDDPRRFGSYRATGEQAIVNAIRDQGARQPILISGIDFAGDFSQWVHYLPRDPLRQLGADVSSFDYADTIGSQGSSLRSIARHHPIVVGGFGDTHCTSSYSEKVMGFMDSVNQSYLAWTWNTAQDYGGCHNALLDDPGRINGYPAGYYSARPSGFGAGVRAHYLRINAHARYR